MRAAELSLAGAAAAIAGHQLSPVELLADVLDRIETLEPTLGAWVEVRVDDARARARTAEREIRARGPRSPVHGVPVAVKDVIDVRGRPTGAGSRVREGHRAETDGTVVHRLDRAGAVGLGKTHTHEFAFGLTTPQTRNAVHPDRVAGGSSGGSAAAVAAGMATFALGTDTGGSIRVPAALNGVVGLKPTFGRVPRTGVVPLSWSLDHVGPITRTVADAALALDVLAGRDPDDPTTWRTPDPSGAHDPVDGVAGLRVGVPGGRWLERVDPDVARLVRTAVGQLVHLGAEAVDVELPMSEHVQAIHWGLMVPEASAYHEQTLRTSARRYGEDVRVLLEAGQLFTAGDHLRAQRARTLYRRGWERVWDDVDLVAMPTVPTTAVARGQQQISWPDGSVESVSDAYVRFNAPANLTGAPALSVPVGHDAAGLPVGMQLIAPAWHEVTLLRVGVAYQASEEHGRPLRSRVVSSSGAPPPGGPRLGR